MALVQLSPNSDQNHTQIVVTAWTNMSVYVSETDFVIFNQSF